MAALLSTCVPRAAKSRREPRAHAAAWHGVGLRLIVARYPPRAPRRALAEYKVETADDDFRPRGEEDGEEEGEEDEAEPLERT